MALSHAAYLYNHTPNSSSGFAPIEHFTSSKSDHSPLLNSHPWGCPVFVLAPKLRDGGKIPKWDPRSKRGQYMGHSPLHSTTVGLIRNLQTGTITPQFHLVFDDFFETIFADDTEAAEEWDNLLVFSRFQSDFDDPDHVPQLDDEWLSPEERHDRRIQQS